MAHHDDLLSLAEDLLAQTGGPGRPRQVLLRRAVSCAYYAVFHLLIHASTEAMQIPPNQDRRRWRRSLGRAFDHAVMARAASGVAAAQVRQIGPIPTPADLQTVCRALVDLRSARHQADYDMNEQFSKEDATNFVDQAKEAFEAWGRVQPDPVAGLFLHLLHSYEGLRGN